MQNTKSFSNKHLVTFYDPEMYLNFSFTLQRRKNSILISMNFFYLSWIYHLDGQ